LIVDQLILSGYNANRIPEKGVVHPIYMPDRTVIFGTFVIQPEAETMIVLDFQFQLYVPFQFHFKQASTTIRRTEKSATVAFGDNDLFQ